MGKTTRTLIAVLLAAAMGAVVVACGSSSDDGAGGGKRGGAITIAQTSNPDYLDPAIGYTVEASESHWIVYPGLLTYKHAEGKEGAKLIPGVVERMPTITNGGKTYAFKLRDGLKYSDGTAAKASDFEHAIQRALTLEWGGLSFFEGIVGADNYLEAGKPGADIAGIESNDKTGEITIDLKQPDGRFEYVLAFPAAGLVPGTTPFKNLSNKPPPGLGSYQFDKVEQNRQYVLTKSRSFNLPGIPAGRVDKITVKLVKSQAKQTQDVISGKLDWMLDEPSTDLLAEVRSKYKDRYEENTANSTYYNFMNTRTKPFDDPKVREAVNHAVDKRALVRIFGGLLEPDCNFLPPLMQGYEKIDPCPWGDPEDAANLAKARKLVDESGTKGTKITVWGNDEERPTKVTQYYADVLNKIGFKAEPKIIGAENYFQTIGNEKTNAQTGFANWFQDFPHPADFFFLVDGKSIQPTNNQNFSNADDPAVNKAAEEIKRESAPDGADKSAALDKLITGPGKAYVNAYGHSQDTTFVSERMDFENCTVYTPVYRDDWSQFCLK